MPAILKEKGHWVLAKEGSSSLPKGALSTHTTCDFSKDKSVLVISPSGLTSQTDRLGAVVLPCPSFTGKTRVQGVEAIHRK